MFNSFAGSRLAFRRVTRSIIQFTERAQRYQIREWVLSCLLRTAHSSFPLHGPYLCVGVVCVGHPNQPCVHRILLLHHRYHHHRHYHRYLLLFLPLLFLFLLFFFTALSHTLTQYQTLLFLYHRWSWWLRRW